MKILVQHVWSARKGTEEERYMRLWDKSLKKNIDLVKDKSTEVVFKIPFGGLRGANAGLESCTYTDLNLFNDVETLRGSMSAEKEGYDAVFECCFFDPVLRPARQALNIPVVGPAEAAIKMATMMGSKFGLVSIGPEANFNLEGLIAEYGMKDRAVQTRPIPASHRQQWQAVEDSRPLIEAFIEVGRKLIKDGAEVLIPGCLIMCACLRMAPGAEKDYPDGLNYVDGVPVLDVVGATIKTIESMVTLKRAGSPWISRKGYFALSRENDQALKEAVEVLEYKGEGFWLDYGID
jgi:allantoin racemase